MELNFLAPMRLMRTIAPAMTGGGRVINILSTAALVGYPYVSAYAASKHALLGATRSLAREFAGKDVTFNAVCPGYVRTEMFSQTIANIAAKTGLSNEEAETKLLRMTPQNRVFEPQEVAHTVAFVLGEQAFGINGQAISIDGGEVEH
jgi:NAD(P)-dependent dehydrogenase (short-subunit alcohol dehydrogenase family)